MAYIDAFYGDGAEPGFAMCGSYLTAFNDGPPSTLRSVPVPDMGGTPINSMSIRRRASAILSADLQSK